jgi:hypothetical protein
MPRDITIRAFDQLRRTSSPRGIPPAPAGGLRGEAERWRARERTGDERDRHRDRWRFERFAQVGEDLADGPRLRDEGDQPDVAATVRALERKLLAYPGQQFRPCNPGGVVRPGLCLSVAAASGAVTVAPMPTGTGIAPLADVPDGEPGHGPPELVIRRKHPVIPVPVLPRRRDEIRQPVEELKRRELDDAVGSRPRGLPPATPPDPGGCLVPARWAAVWAMWRPLQDGQTPRPLHENAMTHPWPQPVQRARPNPKQRMPHSR